MAARRTQEDPIEEADGLAVDIPDLLPPMPLREARESVYGETRNATIGIVGAMERFRVAGKPSLESLMATAADMAVSVEIPEGRKLQPRHVLVALRKAGFGLSRRPDGTLVGFDRSGEILLRTDKEWVIVDTSTAKKMVEEAEKDVHGEKRRAADKARISKTIAGLDHVTGEMVYGGENKEEVGPLSVSPTDPRISPTGLPRGIKGSRTHLQDDGNCPIRSKFRQK